MMTVTQAARQTATRNATKMQGYTFKPAKTSGFFWVVKPNGKDKYLVDTIADRCDCAYSQAEGICKHSLWLSEELAWEAAVEARCAELGEAELARYDLVDAKY